MKTYRGERNNHGRYPVVSIYKDDAFINRLDPLPSQKILNHSPTGFAWGYGGSGPAQLALALIYDATGNVDVSLKLHQPFKWEFVAKWGESWEITEQEVVGWIKSQFKVCTGCIFLGKTSHTPDSDHPEITQEYWMCDSMELNDWKGWMNYTTQETPVMPEWCPGKELK